MGESVLLGAEVIGPMAGSHNARSRRRDQAKGFQMPDLISFERVTDVAMGVALVVTGLWIGIQVNEIGR